MSNTKLFRLAAALLLSAGLSGCGVYYDLTESDPPQPVRVRTQDSDLVFESYQAADAMLAQVPWLRDKKQPLLTASFVNVNDLENSSGLGRMISEQVSSRFAQQGYTMVELKMRNAIFIKEKAGEFALSRSVKAVSQNHNAAAVIAGTYAIGRRSVYINARMIRAIDNVILASYDYSLPLGPDTKALLASQ